MGANISMDVSANIQDAANDATTTATTATTATTVSHQMTFEDKLRQESILIPEDLTDIHIEAAYTNTDDVDTIPDPHTTTDSVEGGRNPRRNPRRKKQPSAAATATAATTVPFQTERTIEQRRAQIRPIMDKLTELQMNVSYPAIRELYKQLQTFVKSGEDAKIKIPFPEFSRRIKGELTNATYKPCWVKLEMD
jgi:hypothetical protein